MRVPCFIYFAETPRYRKRNKETKKNELLSLKLYGICFRIFSFWQRAFLISNSSTEVPKLLTSHFNICLTFKPAQNLSLCDKNCNNINEIHNWEYCMIICGKIHVESLQNTQLKLISVQNQLLKPRLILLTPLFG